MFNKGLNIPVIELHSKKSQSFRNKASDQFRNAKKGVLFTSDVSARGVDYPDVTHVLQFGLPDSREQYIHRLGRTGRAGKEGKGILILAPFESRFLSSLNNIEIPPNSDLAAMLNEPVDKQIMNMVQPVRKSISKNGHDLGQKAEMAYVAFLGFYVGKLKYINLRSKEEIVATANELSALLGLTEIPSLEKRTVGKMGLKGVRGVNVR